MGGLCVLSLLIWLASYHYYLLLSIQTTYWRAWCLMFFYFFIYHLIRFNSEFGALSLLSRLGMHNDVTRGYVLPFSFSFFSRPFLSGEQLRIAACSSHICTLHSTVPAWRKIRFWQIFFSTHFTIRYSKEQRLTYLTIP